MANSDLVHSLLKGIDVLRAVSDAPEGVRLNDLSEGLDMNKSTLHNLVRTLRAREFLVQDASRRLRLGPALAELVHASERSRLLIAAGNQLRKLAPALPGAVFTLSELLSGRIVCRLRISPDRPGELQHPSAQFFPPYTSATGLCLQAFGTATAELEERYHFDEFGAGIWHDIPSFLAALEKIRLAGGSLRDSGSGRRACAFPAAENFALGIAVDGAAADFPALKELGERFRNGLKDEK